MDITVGGIMCAQPAGLGVESEERMCELVRVKSLQRVYDLSGALQARGIDSVVWQPGTRGGRCAYKAGRELVRLMVPERDLTYARWVLRGAGVEAWPA
jgi:hypothetical protein